MPRRTRKRTRSSHELVNARNQAENLIHATEKTLRDLAKDRRWRAPAIESAISDLRTTVKTDNAAPSKPRPGRWPNCPARWPSESTASRATGHGGGSDGPHGGAGGHKPADDGVVDAEFESEEVSAVLTCGKLQIRGTRERSRIFGSDDITWQALATQPHVQARLLRSSQRGSQRQRSRSQANLPAAGDEVAPDRNPGDQVAEERFKGNKEACRGAERLTGGRFTTSSATRGWTARRAVASAASARPPTGRHFRWRVSRHFRRDAGEAAAARTIAGPTCATPWI